MPHRMKRVLVSGGSGFIGRRLVAELTGRGDQVTVLTRDPGKARKHLPERARVAAWDPYRLGSWTAELEVVDAVIHLAGEPIATRWTDKVKQRIVASRVDTTQHLVEAMGAAKHKPKVFVCGSAIGIYGSQPPDVELDESSPAGSGFLADVVTRWEEAARGAEALGIRTAEVRTGVGLGEGGGALEKMILPFKLFGGGPVGTGDQVVSWVHRDDVVGIFLFALDDDRVTGPINAVSPYPATSRELAKAIGAVMNRPSWLKVPSFAVHAAMGEAAQILTEGQRVVPRKAIELGYEFRYARLMPALDSILAHD